MSNVKSNEVLKAARDIRDPWCRCQALAEVAEHCSNTAAKNRVLSEAFEAALEMREPNRVVTVSSWPLKVVCKSGQEVRLKSEVSRLRGIIAAEPSPVRRADAL